MSESNGSPETGPADERSFRAAVERLLGRPEHLSASDLDLVLATLRSHLRHSAVPIDQNETEDLAMAAIVRLIEASQAGRVDPGLNPAGYLLQIGRNLAVDAARGRRGQVRPHSQVPLESLPPGAHPTDDNVARRFDQRATAEIVRHGLERAVREGDATAVKVATFVLDALHTQAETPSSRQIAEALGLSHTGVAKALDRFKNYVRHAQQPD